MRKLLIPVCQAACLLAIVASIGPLARDAGPAFGGRPGPALARPPAQRIYIDLATGQLRAPTAAELAAEGAVAAGGLQASQKRALASPATAADEVQLADGTVGVRPARQFLHTIVLCRQADGRFDAHCPGAGGAQ